uniref:DNA-directed DNA polymerase X domain-containing protein n=1 Tax=Chromera velia CCMP2878 TaxID=1169474 RepID=A0A0G4HEU9_9ALVE|eukprot:Cvel_26885.t1-p1 / transcript=Cvel_26885.t1 / gene=Cvel_26885 / organism=Chromera_velia_CCMP2878 / gene_product=DNA polymerase lambda, putative / transcript_product=DNA polymerase lambda, putative / location=Cvel_scaffold3268:13484-16465(+) / protein_length=741 / sequence_SO=supercontig / SO=protein_coding / is_pseudo=false
MALRDKVILLVPLGDLPQARCDIFRTQLEKIGASCSTPQTVSQRLKAATVDTEERQGRGDSSGPVEIIIVVSGEVAETKLLSFLRQKRLVPPVERETEEPGLFLLKRGCVCVTTEWLSDALVSARAVPPSLPPFRTSLHPLSLRHFLRSPLTQKRRSTSQTHAEVSGPGSGSTKRKRQGTAEPPDEGGQGKRTTSSVKKEEKESEEDDSVVAVRVAASAPSHPSSSSSSTALRPSADPPADRHSVAVPSPSPSVSPNDALSEEFKRLRDAYKAQKGEYWRGRAYERVVQVLSSLPFQIETEEDLDRPECAHVFGPKTKSREKAVEFLNSGKIRRVQEVSGDPRSEALRLFTQIHGVGPAEAERLYNSGFRSIEDLRANRPSAAGPSSVGVGGSSGGHRGGHVLTSVQRKGLEYLEDFLIKIPRKHAEIVENLLRRVATDVFGRGEMEVVLGGSYRRGKQQVGDIDVILLKRGTDLQYNPLPDLRRFLQALKATGLIVDTLSDPFHEGGQQEGRPPGSAGTSPPTPTYRQKNLDSFLQGGGGKGGHRRRGEDPALPPTAFHSPTFLGVCVLPKDGEGGDEGFPIDSGRKGRIDIKIYPDSLRGFALLHFTGDGNFNRLMRLYVRKGGLSLSDHGLTALERVRVGDPMGALTEGIVVDGGARIECDTEEQIFRALHLPFRPPEHRAVDHAWLRDCDPSTAAQRFSVNPPSAAERAHTSVKPEKREVKAEGGRGITREYEDDNK